MSTFTHAANVSMTIDRCWDCGQWWAMESGRTGVCPNCAHRRIQAALDEVDQWARKASALRGAVTRAKKVRKK